MLHRKLLPPLPPKECFMCTKRVPSMYENKKNAYNLELSDNSRIFALVETN